MGLVGQVSRRPTGNYHIMFRDISKKTLAIIKKYVKVEGLWRVDREAGFDLLRNMFAELSEVYGITIPSLIEASHEHYVPHMERIGLPKVSLVSALHEYRHHMQHHRRQKYQDIEVDARAWSVSAFKLALPTEFKSAWKRGLIWFLPPYEED